MFETEQRLHACENELSADSAGHRAWSFKVQHADEQLAAARVEHRLLREREQERRLCCQQFTNFLEDLRTNSCEGATIQKTLGHRLSTLQGVVSSLRASSDSTLRNNHVEPDEAEFAHAVE